MSNNPFPIPFFDPRRDSYAGRNLSPPKTYTVWHNQTKIDQFDLASGSKIIKYLYMDTASLYSGRSHSSSELVEGESIDGSSSSSIG